MGTTGQSPTSIDTSADTSRQEVRFVSGGQECVAWLYTAHDARTPGPMVVMGHGLGAVRQMRLDAFAERFAAAGWSVLVFDYRYLGASGGQPRQLIDIGAQLADWHAALAYARSLPFVDTQRIAVWGSSFGGGHVLQVAAADGRVAAVVAQCPFTDGPASTLARLRAGVPSMLILGGAALLDTVGSWFGARPVLMPMAGPSWLPGFLVSPDTVSGASQLVPAGTLLSARTSAALRRLPRLRAQLAPHLELSGNLSPAEPGIGRDSLWGVLTGPRGSFTAANALSARLALRLPFYRPGRAMVRIQAPTLVCVCDHDAVAPAAATIAHAADAAHVHIRTYPCAHFDIYVGTHFEQAVRDQILFLAEQFGDTAAAHH
ncbi:alpha/beta hydrolase [Nocardia sp. CA-290969]|uniref:alpha/beta hydrolase n=1 Tax=Nocardia sp. CA-290969 TaxID=3239986 RepID=UPI003D93E8E5